MVVSSGNVVHIIYKIKYPFGQHKRKKRLYDNYLEVAVALVTSYVNEVVSLRFSIRLPSSKLFYTEIK